MSKNAIHRVKNLSNGIQDYSPASDFNNGKKAERNTLAVMNEMSRILGIQAHT